MSTATRLDRASRHSGVCGAKGWCQAASQWWRTPSGGLHAYFTGTDQRNGHLAAHHLDFRGQGGYVLAPPSTVSGKPYVVVHRRAINAVFNWRAARALLDPQPWRHEGHLGRQGRWSA